MAAHTIPLPFPLRWFFVRAAAWSALAAAALLVKRRAQRPTVTPMSDEWLDSQAYDHSSTE
jgi:hypothetical protein